MQSVYLVFLETGTNISILISCLVILVDLPLICFLINDCFLQCVHVGLSLQQVSKSYSDYGTAVVNLIQCSLVQYIVHKDIYMAVLFHDKAVLPAVQLQQASTWESEALSYRQQVREITLWYMIASLLAAILRPVPQLLL